MNFQEKIQSIESDIVRQLQVLALCRTCAELFDGVELPAGVRIWAYPYTNYSEVEFSAGYGEDDVKDLQPLAHALCRHLGVDFDKRKNYDNSALEYVARVTRDDREYKIVVAGVVPATCKLVEKVVEKSAEEIAAEHAAIETTRIVREIVCVEPEVVE